MKFKSVLAATLTAGTMFLAAAPASAQVITEPTHLTAEFQPGECTLTVGNGRSVHAGTTLVAHDLDTWGTLGTLADVEREAFVVTSTQIVVPESGEIDLYAIPAAGGISSLDLSAVTCIPTPGPVVPEPVAELPVAAAPVVPAPVVDYAPTPTPAPVVSEPVEGPEHLPTVEPIVEPIEVAAAAAAEPSPALEAEPEPAPASAAVDRYDGNPEPVSLPVPVLDVEPVELAETAELAYTGAELNLAAAGLLATLAGAAAVVVARRRRV